MDPATMGLIAAAAGGGMSMAGSLMEDDEPGVPGQPWRAPTLGMPGGAQGGAPALSAGSPNPYGGLGGCQQSDLQQGLNAGAMGMGLLSKALGLWGDSDDEAPDTSQGIDWTGGGPAQYNSAPAGNSMGHPANYDLLPDHSFLGGPGLDYRSLA